jgi:LRR receptor-like serine/threonine-protein kinase FLS2
LLTITHLFVCLCSLSGTLPKAIAAANYLTQLRLGNNKLAGTVPLAINTLSHLSELDLSDNVGLTGTLPKMKYVGPRQGW